MLCYRKSASIFHLSHVGGSQAVSMRHWGANHWCSMTYLAGVVECLAKRKGKTQYTHKSNGCALGCCCRLSLINRQGQREAKQGSSDRTKRRWKQVDLLTYPTMCLLFSPSLCASSTTTLSPGSQNTGEKNHRISNKNTPAWKPDRTEHTQACFVCYIDQKASQGVPLIS